MLCILKQMHFRLKLYEFEAKAISADLETCESEQTIFVTLK